MLHDCIIFLTIFILVCNIYVQFFCLSFPFNIIYLTERNLFLQKQQCFDDAHTMKKGEKIILC